MREKTGAGQNRATGTGRRPPWTVVEVQPLPDYRLEVQFADGTQGVVDVSKLILGRNPGVFQALRDPAAFARVRVDAGVVTWADDPDLAPDAMYDEIRANGYWILDA